MYVYMEVIFVYVRITGLDKTGVDKLGLNHMEVHVYTICVSVLQHLELLLAQLKDMALKHTSVEVTTPPHFIT